MRFIAVLSALVAVTSVGAVSYDDSMPSLVGVNLAAYVAH